MLNQTSVGYDPVVIATIVATAVIIATLFYAVRRSGNLTDYISKEEELTRQVHALRKEIDALIESHKREVEELRHDISALQRMLLDKEKDNNELRQRLVELERHRTTGTPKKQSLVVALGTDKMLQVDVAKLRGIKTLQLSVLQDATKKDVETVINTRRSQGKPIKLLHLSVHSNENGVLFSDGIADGIWLSQNLKGVEVLVIAGCKSYRIANLLSVVPSVVSMRDEVDNEDASTFSFHFWTAIGDGQNPEDAFDIAIEKSSATLSEMAEFHSY